MVLVLRTELAERLLLRPKRWNNLNEKGKYPYKHRDLRGAYASLEIKIIYLVLRNISI